MKLFKDGIFEWKKTILLIFIVNIITIIVVCLQLPKLPPVVPLYYGNPAGEEQLGPVRGLFIPPGFTLVVWVTAVLITKAYKNSFIETLLVLSLCVLTVLSTVTVFKIMFLVGSF